MASHGFAGRVERVDGSEVVCRMFHSRWHGYARYTIERRSQDGDITLIEYLEDGWVWRGRNAPYYEFGPSRIEIHGGMLVDNRREVS